MESFVKTFDYSGEINSTQDLEDFATEYGVDHEDMGKVVSFMQSIYKAVFNQQDEGSGAWAIEEYAKYDVINDAIKDREEKLKLVRNNRDFDRLVGEIDSLNKIAKGKYVDRQQAFNKLDGGNQKYFDFYIFFAKTLMRKIEDPKHYSKIFPMGGTTISSIK